MVMGSQGESLAHFINESKIIEQHTGERILNDHRIDSLILLVYIILLIFSVITIWLFKHRRFPYIHETGLSVIYGLIVGAVLPYAIKSLNSTDVETKIRHLNKSWGNSLPPEILVLQQLASDKLGKSNSSISLQYRLEGTYDESSVLHNKVTFDPEFFFNVLLPPIIFTASYSMKRKHFFKNIGAILLYAFVGTLLSALVVGVICYGFTRGISSIAPTLNLSDCILFGSMISATDPVTVLAIFNDLKVDVDLYALVFGESVLNDALAIALAQSVEQYGSLSAGNFDGNALLSSVSHFLMMFGGSFSIGILVGCLTALLTKFTYIREHPILETALFVLMSYSTFLTAETIGFTGIVAVLFCGITQAHYTYNNLSDESKLWTKQIFELLNFLAENFVFAYIGVCTFTSQHHYWDVRFVFIALFACIVARAANIYPLSALVNWCPRSCLRKSRVPLNSSTIDLVNRDPNLSKFSPRNSPIKVNTESITSSHCCSIRGPNRIPYNMQHMLFFSGLRGAMAFSLAIRNTSSRTRQMFFSTTIVVVMTTVLLSSCFVTSLLRWLKIPVGTDAVPEDDTSSSESSSNSSDRGCCSYYWSKFDKFYLKPLLTHSEPPLTETLPTCCYGFARLLTTNEQRLRLFNNDFAPNSQDEIPPRLHDMRNITPTVSYVHEADNSGHISTSLNGENSISMHAPDQVNQANLRSVAFRDSSDNPIYSRTNTPKSQFGSPFTESRIL